MSRGRWLQLVSTLNYNSFAATTILYDPLNHNKYNQKSYVKWTTSLTSEPITFQSTDYISFRHADVSDYAATDASFSGAFATPHYLPDDDLSFAFGVFESKIIFCYHVYTHKIANYLVVYQFSSSTTTVKDHSGFGFDGTMSSLAYNA